VRIVLRVGAITPPGVDARRAVDAEDGVAFSVARAGDAGPLGETEGVIAERRDAKAIAGTPALIVAANVHADLAVLHMAVLAFLVLFLPRALVRAALPARRALLAGRRAALGLDGVLPLAPQGVMRKRPRNGPA
jgi:hypothetical protein